MKRGGWKYSYNYFAHPESNVDEETDATMASAFWPVVLTAYAVFCVFMIVSIPFVYIHEVIVGKPKSEK